VNMNFTDSPTSEDLHGHGTHVAGIIAAQVNNSIGIAGIAPQVKLMNVKVANDNGYCRAGTITKGIYWAVDNGAMVINISLELQGFSKELEQAIDYAWSRGVIVIAAAGNDASNTPVYPAFSENCIAVGAVGQNDELAPLSNYGDWVDIAAPGFKIYTTATDNLYGCVTGTSFAAAYVSGLAAILTGSIVDSNGDGWTNDEVRRAIENGCHKTGTDGTGYGVIDVTRSLSIRG
jgi:thermitase